MTREFSLKLLERVVTTFCFVMASTYAAGSVAIAFHQQTPLSIAQRSLVAGIAAVVQLLLGALVGPHIGNPNSPSLLPTAILRRFGKLPEPPKTQLVVTLEDVVGATVKQMVKDNPTAVAVKPEDVAKEVIADAIAKQTPRAPEPATPQLPTSDPADIP